MNLMATMKIDDKHKQNSNEPFTSFELYARPSKLSDDLLSMEIGAVGYTIDGLKMVVNHGSDRTD